MDLHKPEVTCPGHPSSQDSDPLPASSPQDQQYKNTSRARHLISAQVVTCVEQIPLSSLLPSSSELDEDGREMVCAICLQSIHEQAVSFLCSTEHLLLQKTFPKTTTQTKSFIPNHTYLNCLITVVSHKYTPPFAILAFVQNAGRGGLICPPPPLPVP